MAKKNLKNTKMINKGSRGGHVPSGGVGMRGDLQLIQSDPRFAHVTSDPKFRHVPKEQRKVKLDSRFHSVLTDDKFYEKSTMDPRGRKGNYSTKENLLKFYHMSSDDDDDDDEEEEEEEEEEEDSDNDGEQSVGGEESPLGTKAAWQDTKAKGKNTGKAENVVDREKKSSVFSEKERARVREEKERSEITQDITCRLRDLSQDYARGGNTLFSSDSSDDDSSTTDDEEVEGEEFEWGELDQDAVWDNEVEVEETSRIAVCNLDWDRIKAADIMVLFTSFCPRGGSVQRVTIYPSEYGRQRMAEEDQAGPQELKSSDGDDKSDPVRMDLVDLDKLEKGKLDTNAGSTKAHFEALRRYQRNRLRYYYAVVECNSLDTARALYQECDRQPYEGAGILLDLRYIPSDLTFNETPHDLCETVPKSYEVKNFTTTALHDSRPVLTWDETDPERKKALSLAMTKAIKGEQVDEEYLKDLIASSSEDGEDDDLLNDGDSISDDSDEDAKAARIAKFRALMREIDEKEQRKKGEAIDMEEDFDVEKQDSSDEEEGDEAEEDEVNGIKGYSQLNPFEKYLEKRKAKRKAKMEKKAKGNRLEESDSEPEGSISDDELPESTRELYADPFFAQELEKMKVGKAGKKKRQPAKEANEEEENENSQGNLELLLMEEDNKEKKHFNMREIIQNSEAKTKKKRRKNKLKKKMIEKQQKEESKVDDFKVDINDSRFMELLTSGEYNIDPSHPMFKRTQAMDHLINNIQRKRMAESYEDVPGAKRPHLVGGTRDQQLSSLVKRVKRKTGKGRKF